ncbi:HAMP domain-containing sensor histidine kinase [Wukongibacter baidiensis]|uniref:sensor histidine kinase n=1 Tax=Wukongibacter baidiensis TaxID=1723361 RepID=UPI003D7F5C28
MKNSIGIKLFIGITCFALIIVSLSWILNTNYLEGYYLRKKQDSIIKYGKEIQSDYNNDYIYDNNDKLKNIENAIGGDITIIDGFGDAIYSSSIMQFRGGGKGKGKGSSWGLGLISDEGLQMLLDGNTVLESYVHPRFHTVSLVLASPLENGHVLIMESPLASIKESVEIAQDFHIYIAIISLIIGTIIAFIFSKIFTKPIIKLNNVAKSMAHLDFSKKYTINGNDEINQLGKTINFLSDKLDASISELNRANERLQEDIEKERKLEKLRKEFVSSVSHELKTPIALIQGYGEGLKDAVIEDEDSKNFYCDVIVDEAQKMDKLVKDLLNLSALESGHYQLQRENFNIYDLIEAIINKYTPILNEKDINLEFDSDDIKMKVFADPIRIEQVLVNFVNNAINHVNEKKNIKINIIDYIEKIKITVTNTGKPIPETEIDKIWDSFYKLDKSRAREYGGTGLGLSIVKGILKLHNSNFGVQNVDSGVKFWFDIDKVL